jgi:hypothetical protein
MKSRELSKWEINGIEQSNFNFDEQPLARKGEQMVRLKSGTTQELSGNI